MWSTLRLGFTTPQSTSISGLEGQHERMYCRYGKKHRKVKKYIKFPHKDEDSVR
jgi:hypothetical protein